MNIHLKHPKGENVLSIGKTISMIAGGLTFLRAECNDLYVGM